MAKKIIIIIVILILLGIILLFLFNQREEVPVIDYQEPEIGQPTIEWPMIPTGELTPEQRQDLAKNELRALVRNFIERYGSFSTDAQFANLRELKDQMSTRFWQETENYIIANQDKEINQFYGVSTKVLNIREISYNQDRVVFEAMTQRKETRGMVEGILYQNAEIIIIKEGESWLVDLFNWQ